MRDLLVALIVFGAIPFVVKRPFWGIVLLAGLGYMNPHRLCYGFMFNMPVLMIVALVTLIAMLNSKEAKQMVWSREIVLLVIFALMSIYLVNYKYFQIASEVKIFGEVGLYFFNLAACGFVVVALSGRFLYPSISLEGRSFWLLIERFK